MCKFWQSAEANRSCDASKAVVCFQGQESMDRAWRGAEANHFWMLAHRQLYDGAFRAGLRTALNLRRYEDVLPALRICSLLALMAFCAGYYGQCSKALSKLEHMEELSIEQREAFSELATAIFVEHSPVVWPWYTA
jgi:WD repeat-containing protein 35